MPYSKTLADFLQDNHVDSEAWKASNLEWKVLQEIGSHYESQQIELHESAGLFARIIQNFGNVHSVRWRVKETDHLLEKIIRKRANNQEKYLEISAENYSEIITDLIGLRALHLFKHDCFEIDERLKTTWEPIEQPIAYIREGDPENLNCLFRERGFRVEKHKAGYRSIHYLFSTKPTRRKITAEVQVRTIFEEGWSEIDHRLRYPNFSDNEQISYFLTIFNRLAGSADEMGTFVQGLSRSLWLSAQQISDANSKRDEALLAMENTLSELKLMKQADVETKKKLKILEADLAKVRGATAPSNYLETIDSSKNIASAIVRDNDFVKKYYEIQARERAALAELAKGSISANHLAAALYGRSIDSKKSTEDR